MPQTPGQGSTHLWLIQAWLLGHSVLITHSGLQFGGVPMKSGEQEQLAFPATLWHRLFGPQGDGEQGSGTLG